MKLLSNVYNQEDIKQLENIVNIEFSAEQEDISPYDQLDEETAKQVCEDAESNDAAWFCAKVTVSFKDFVESDYLGACSYRSFREFKEDAYYTDMVNTCINEINRQIESINYGIQRLWDIRRAKNIIGKYDLIITDLKTVPAY